MFHIAFRTDASLDIGTGHVMRCLTLADALGKQGIQCCFICRAHPGNLIDLIRQRGYNVHVLPPPLNNLYPPSPSHAAWLGVDWELDGQETLSCLHGKAIDCLVVDHYALDACWEGLLRSVCACLVVIDDLADRAHNCDLLLDQNLHNTVADYTDLLPPSCPIVLGPAFALLHPAFAARRGQSFARRISPQLKHLFISMGGVDKENITLEVLDALGACSLPRDCHITVVMGPHAPWAGAIKTKATTLPWVTDVLVSISASDMAQQMTKSDLVMGAAGSSVWERCALGLPALLFMLAKNQQSTAHAVVAAGAAQGIETGPSLKPTVQNKIRQCIHNPAQLKTMSDAASALCDGQGTTRFCEQLLKTIKARIV